MSRNHSLVIASLLLMTSCWESSASDAVGEAVSAPQQVDAPAAPTQPSGAGNLSLVVQKVLPSIVFIQAEGAPPEEIERLLPPGRQLPETVPIGVGSGVIISKEGHILTNNHVVREADRVLVVLHDRRYFEATVVGRDPSTEVAVVRIDAPDLTVARLGDSDAVALGDPVIAMGSPLGLQFSVTAGIVSGTGRMLGILGEEAEQGPGPVAPLEHFIQTDAALSPGNSGGPLVSLAGEVIGINTAVASGGPAPAGFGFSIPSNLAWRVADQLMQHGQVRRSYLGAALMNVSPSLARQRGLDRVEGAAVVRVEEGGPAARAGLQGGDVIVRLGRVPVQTVSDLQAELAALRPGASLTLSVVRERKPLRIDVELGEVRSGVDP